MDERIETVIVGGGQAGLATSYYLSQLRRDHIVLEQSEKAGSVWQNERWDSFTLVTPNWVFRMPGQTIRESDPDGYLTRQEVVSFFDRYVEQYNLPVRCNTRVEWVDPNEDHGYLVRAGGRTYHANNVVMATGFCQQPKIPPAAANLSPSIHQYHSSQYRNPQAVPDGAVLVVGSAQSGCQIAEELYQHGRTVYLSTGSAGRAPRRYRGKDILTWLDAVGFFDLTPEQLPPGMSRFGGIPHVSGTKGGHTLNLHQFARDGVTLLGHLRGAENGRIFLAPDLHENLAKADQFELQATQMIDQFIRKSGTSAPEEVLQVLRDGFDQPVIEELDLHAAGIKTIIWAGGYRFDYSIVRLPVRDADGFPVQEHGVTRYPGLYFVGMPWMPSQKSGFLLGVSDSARKIAMGISQANKPN